MKSRFPLSNLFLPLLPLLAVTVAAEICIRSGLIKDFILPAPSQVARAFAENRSELFSALFETGGAAVAGLVLSFTAGTGVAVLLSMSSILRRAFLPYAIFFQTVPVIAIAPLLVIWFGFGLPTVIASAFIVSIFPIIASTLLGLQSTDPALLDLFSLYSASRADYLFRLRIPFALPQIFGGLRIASGLAVIGAVVGEFIGGGGLGAIVDVARTQQRIDLVFAAVLISSLLGLTIVAVVNFLSRLALRRWHASEQ